MYGLVGWLQGASKACHATFRREANEREERLAAEKREVCRPISSNERRAGGWGAGGRAAVEICLERRNPEAFQLPAE